MPKLAFSTPALRDMAEIEERIEALSESDKTAQNFVELIIDK